LPFCTRCGTELPSGAKFCLSCGSPTNAPILPPPPTIKPSHTKRNASILIIALLIGIITASSRAPAQTPNQTNTELQEGTTIRLNQPFIMNMGSDNVPIQFTFNGTWVWRNAAGSAPSYAAADPGYKYFDLQIVAKNVGLTESSTFPILSIWETVVDRGYIYKSTDNPFFGESVRPEEVKTAIIDFEILATTTPVEVRYYDSCLGSTSNCSPTFTVDLRNTTIPTREELFLNPAGFTCEIDAQRGQRLLLNFTNPGLVDITLTSVSINRQVVFTTPTRIAIGQTVSIPVTVPIDAPFEIEATTASGSTLTFECGY